MVKINNYRMTEIFGSSLYNMGNIYRRKKGGMKQDSKGRNNIDSILAKVAIVVSSFYVHFKFSFFQGNSIFFQRLRCTQICPAPKSCKSISSAIQCCILHRCTNSKRLNIGTNLQQPTTTRPN